MTSERSRRRQPGAVAEFDRDTAVERIGDDLFEARFARGWWVVRGPNGGYVAAILLRALTQAVADAGRAPRSLTVHYTAPPREGPARIATRRERTGRSLTTVSARLEQDGRLLALALGAFSAPRSAPGFQDARMPEVPAPEALEPMFAPGSGLIPIHERYDYRWALGRPPWSAAKRALAGGWIRLRDARPVDALALAAFTDAWPPSVFSRAEPGAFAGGVPTVDLTMHFRAPLAPDAAHAGDSGDGADFVLARFETRVGRDGFIEEDGELWSRSGNLLAQSRQLAILA